MADQESYKQVKEEVEEERRAWGPLGNASGDRYGEVAFQVLRQERVVGLEKGGDEADGDCQALAGSEDIEEGVAAYRVICLLEVNKESPTFLT